MNGDRKRADVAVVGGGVIGAAAALELARRGASVVLLERGGDLAWGCSAGNAGIVGPGHVQPLANPAAVVDGIRWMGRPDSPFFVRPRPGVVPWLTRFLAAAAPSRVQHSTSVLQRLAVRSAELHAELHAGGLDAGYQQRGLLDVFRGEKAFRAAVGAVGPGDEVVRVEDLPGQLGPGFAGGVLRRGEAHCDPLRFVLALGAWAAEVGVEIRTGVEVLGLRRTGRRVDALWTTEGDVEVAEVVVAAGVWSAGLAGELGLRLPIEGGKGYHVDIEARPGDPELPIWLHEHRVVVTPNGPRIRLAGTMELTGTDRGVDQRRVDAITRAATEALPGFAGRPPLHVWRGLRPCTPDGLPIIGRAPALDNLTLATGHGMWGLQLAPLTARLAASIALGTAPECDVAPLRADRFSAPWRAGGRNHDAHAVEV